MSANEWHRAVIAAERDLTAYFARWSRVHLPRTDPPARITDRTTMVQLLALTCAVSSRTGTR